MHATAKAFALFVCLAAAAPARAEPSRELLALQESIEQLIAKAEPAVACILVSRSEAYRRYEPPPPQQDTPGRLGRFEMPFAGNDPNDDRTRALRALDLSRPDTIPESYGSGIVIDPAGLILTCAHVVRNAAKVYVRLPGGKGSWADIHAADPRSDLAVLRLLDVPNGLTAIKFGDGGKLRKGQIVVGLANPFAAGFRDGSASASWGIVGNLRRRAPGPLSEVDRAKQSFHHYGTLIQTDVRLNLGCSGGALLNLDGELVGITSALAALTGVEAPGGFAVPVDDKLRRIIDVLARGAEVEYGFLGVTLNPQARPGQGVQLNTVSPNGPANRAGIVGGDWVLKINGVPIRENDDLFLQIGSHLAGTEVTIELGRGPDGPPKNVVRARLAKYHVPGTPLASKRPAPRGGLRVDYTSILAQRDLFQQRAIPQGVVIREVAPNSPAGKQPLLQLDRVITRVNGVQLNVPADFYREMDRAGGRAELTVVNPEGAEERVTLDAR